MIDDLDRTLEALLQQELPSDLASQVAISFVTPDDQFPPSSVKLPALDLFLFDIRENRDLRTNEVVVNRGDGNQVTRQQPPLRVDCSYLVTAWASESSPFDEHQLLGRSMAALLRYATIPEPLLQGAIAGQEPPLPATALQPDRLQSQAGLWQALKGKPRASFVYTVTISAEALEAIPAGPPVQEAILRFNVEGKQE